MRPNQLTLGGHLTRTTRLVDQHKDTLREGTRDEQQHEILPIGIALLILAGIGTFELYHLMGINPLYYLR